LPSVCTRLQMFWSEEAKEKREGEKRGQKRRENTGEERKVGVERGGKTGGPPSFRMWLRHRCFVHVVQRVAANRRCLTAAAGDCRTPVQSCAAPAERRDIHSRDGRRLQLVRSCVPSVVAFRCPATRPFCTDAGTCRRLPTQLAHTADLWPIHNYDADETRLDSTQMS